MSRHLLALFLALILLLAACTTGGEPVAATRPSAAGATQPVTDPATVDGSEWWLVAVDGMPVSPTATEPPIDLRFYAAGDGRETNEYAAFTGCNHLGGTFTLSADRAGDLVFHQTGITRSACPAELEPQEQAILSALAAATALRRNDTGELLVLDAAEQIRLRYEPKPAPQVDPALAGSEWQLLTLRGAPAVPGAPLTFDVEAGSIGGNTGCNNYGGEIRTLADGVFDVPEIFFTEAGCEGARGVLEATYRDLLWQEVSGYRLEGDRLLLLNADGDTVATFAPRAQTQNDPLALDNTTWLLDTVDGKAPVTPRAITLYFATMGPVETANGGRAGGRYGGQDGCRSFVGAFSASADDITFTSVSMLGEPCADEQLHLPPGGDYALVDGQLTISGPEGRFAYTPLPPTAQPPLAGTTWHLLAFVGPTAAPATVQPALVATDITLAFADGMVAGNAGCNRYETTYIQDGAALSLGALVAGDETCRAPQPVLDQESGYLSRLQVVERYTLAGPHLWLHLPDGAAMVYTDSRSS